MKGGDANTLPNSICMIHREICSLSSIESRIEVEATHHPVEMMLLRLSWVPTASIWNTEDTFLICSSTIGDGNANKNSVWIV
jgi:hypothetical protein